MIRKLRSGLFRLYSHGRDPRTGKRRNLGTFKSYAEAVKHEIEIEYFRKKRLLKAFQEGVARRASQMNARRLKQQKKRNVSAS